MKSTLVFLLVLLLAATPGSAQSLGMVELTLGGGPYQSKVAGYFMGCGGGGVKGTGLFSPCPIDQKTTPLFSGRLRVWLARSFAVEGSVAASPEAEDTPLFTSLRGVLTVAPRSRLSAYVLGGPALVAFYQSPATLGGLGHYRSPLTLAGVLGVGTYFHMSPSLALRAELERYLYDQGELGVHENTFMTLGLSVALRNGHRGNGSDVAKD